MPIRRRSHADTVSAVPTDAMTEREIRAVISDAWSRLLELGPLGDHDSFFGFGGHSILALRAVELVREATGVEVPMSVFLADPTPSAVGRFVHQHLEAPPERA
jgi:arthrofactin-type cyclic lipopeptide synthetase C